MVINCAFIGFGKSTTRYHLPYVLNRKDSWHVAHIFRRHAKPEEQAPIYSHIHFTSDLDEVLNDPDVKLVVVCTHADSHFEYAKRALEAGKNVLVEKPFTPTLAQAKELFALAKSKGLTVTPYQNRRFDSCFLTAKKAIESGKLGEIVEVESLLQGRTQQQIFRCGAVCQLRSATAIGLTGEKNDIHLFLCGRIDSLYTLMTEPGDLFLRLVIKAFRNVQDFQIAFTHHSFAVDGFDIGAADQLILLFVSSGQSIGRSSKSVVGG